MGWSRGSTVADPIIRKMKEVVPSEKARFEIYLTMIQAFWEQDWDTEDEVEGIDPIFDLALRKANERYD